MKNCSEAWPKLLINLFIFIFFNRILSAGRLCGSRKVIFMAGEVYRTRMFRLSNTTQLDLFVIKLCFKACNFQWAIKKGVGFVWYLRWSTHRYGSGSAINSVFKNVVPNLKKKRKETKQKRTAFKFRTPVLLS